MIKKTLYFGSPVYLSYRMGQLVIQQPDVEKNKDMPPWMKKELTTTRPVEDIGVVVIDHKQVTLTHGLIAALLENNCALITCNDKSMPVGLMLPLDGNTVQNERFRHQLEASLPLKKQLWQQTVKAKIQNQATLLRHCTGEQITGMMRWAEDVRSGDPDNLEGRAAAHYWRHLFTPVPGMENFTRNHEEDGANALLNYGYAILRAVVARALVSSGLLPTLGIHHHNRYNAYCLADDIMEPYRPCVDHIVFDFISEARGENLCLNKEAKARLLSVPVADVRINGQRSPLMVAVSQTTASLFRCFSGEARRILYPEMEL